MQVTEVQIIYTSKVKSTDRPFIRNSRDVYDIFLDHWNRQKIDLVEQFKILLLNRAKRVLGIYEVSSGGMTETVADARLIFVAALKAAAAGIILCHNHPSKELVPSLRDDQLTKQLIAAGKFLNIEVLDHLIISTEGYYSFADEGRM